MVGGAGGRPLFSSLLSVCFVSVPPGPVLSLNILFLTSSVYTKKLTPGGQVGNNKQHAETSRASSARVVGEYRLLPQPRPAEALLVSVSCAKELCGFVFRCRVGWSQQYCDKPVS